MKSAFWGSILNAANPKTVTLQRIAVEVTRLGIPLLVVAMYSWL